jgi:RimJ/RimL family protein N-acetyltransferase
MLSVREIQLKDIEPLSNYWLNADPEFMKGMGVDLSKMPPRKEWEQMLLDQINTPIPQKKSYAIIWEENGIAIGHSNISKISFGKGAYMHLHLWGNVSRKKGIGTEFVILTLPFYFEKFQLKTLYCEPYALNPAPNKTMEKLGFKFLRSYIGIPGWLNFEQEVNVWELSLEDFKSLYA